MGNTDGFTFLLLLGAMIGACLTLAAFVIGVVTDVPDTRLRPIVFSMGIVSIIIAMVAFARYFG